MEGTPAAEDQQIEMTSATENTEIEATLATAEHKESGERTQWPKNSIFRAPAHIRSSRELHFEPKHVSIGPYHHGQPKLKHMEDLKLRCIPEILKKEIINSFNPKHSEAVIPRRRQSIYNVPAEPSTQEEMGIDDVPIVPFMEWEGDARAYYKHEVIHEPIDFVRMLVLDSLFFIRTVFAVFQPVESMAFLDEHIKDVRSDLLLLENQIPLFFIRKVYEWLVPCANHPEVPPFVTVLEPFICLDIPWRINHVSQAAAHFLDLYWRCSLPPWMYMELFERELKDVGQNRGYLSELVRRLHLRRSLRLDRYLFVQIREYLSELIQRYSNELARDVSYQIEYRPDSSEQESDVSSKEKATLAKIHLSNNAPMVIANATELQKMAGIEFEKYNDRGHLDVVFSNGIMRMPRLKIDRWQTILLRNLIAYENCILPTWRIFSCYMKLMDALIDSAKDVKLLQKCGIIYNTLNSHHTAATFFNEVGNFCFIDNDTNLFSGLYKDVQKYYDSRWHRRWASLRQNYFSSPWAGISVVAAVTLLILSALQTFYTIYGYY